MQQINELSDMLNQHFKWNKAKMDCFCGMLIGLIKVRSINLTKIANAYPSQAEPDSRYRRMQRFIHDYPVNFDTVAWFMMKLFNFLNERFYLTLDRTNWQWGEMNINILVLALVYKGAAIPIYWLVLNKKGNSNTRERIALMKRFIQQFGKNNIIAVLADREFIGETWFKWLKSEDIHLHIRLKKDAKVPNSRGELVQAHVLFRFLKVGEQLIIKEARKVTDVEVYLSALRLEDGKLLILASSELIEQPLEAYAKRWEIETLFSCLKERGFNLEDTRITKLIRIKRVLVVVVIAFAWAHRTGEWRHENVKPIRITKTLERPAKSIFRYGLDWLQDKLQNVADSLKTLLHFLVFKELCEAR
jgi:Transposase DDE domain